MFVVRRVLSHDKWLPNIRTLSSQRPLVDLTVDNDGVAVMTLQRPPVNSLNLDILKEMSRALDDVDRNKSKAMILTSAIPKVFSAGIDVMELYKPDIERLKDFLWTLQEVWLKLFGSNFITASVINGHAPAGGCLIATSCEYRVMNSGKFTIGLNESALGMVAPSWFMDTMTSIVSMREAEYALTTGRLFTVEEALKVLLKSITQNIDNPQPIDNSEFRSESSAHRQRWGDDLIDTAGLIDEVATDKADAIAKCKKFIGKFDKISPLVRSQTKLRIRRNTIKNLQDCRQADADGLLEMILSPITQESLEKYLL